ncbi:MAG: endonuclease/exonuclease/phosphatase family protein [Aggregatilineales bacterium]
MMYRKWALIMALLTGILIMPLSAQENSPVTDCTATLEIAQIQGAGDEANCFGETVTLSGNNIVTVIARQGFFIQTLPDFIDDDPYSSDGIYIHTERFPGRWVQVGDVVTLYGRVDELFNTSTLRVPSEGRITISESGATLPDPVNLQEVDLSDYGGASHPLERYEGMRVAVTDAFVTAATNQFDEFDVALNDERAFRETGIEPDLTPQFAGLGLPEWDLNPEVVEVDAQETGLTVEQIPTGSRATVTGALSYNFADYQIFPSEISVVEADPPIRPVRERVDGEFTIATQNVENLFDFTDDPNREDYRENYAPQNQEEYELRLGKAAEQILVVLGAPDIIALQEVENARVLTDLALRIYDADPTIRYAGCIIEGFEGRGIDVAYLVRTERVSLLNCYRMPGADEVVLENSLGVLFTRPPLVLEAEFIVGREQAFSITLINVHNRSLSDADTENVQARRLRQAEAVANYIQELQTNDPEMHIAVLGDFNAFQFSDGLVDVMGIITGTTVSEDALVGGMDDLVEPDFINQVMRVPEEDRYSYVYNGSAQVLDHILTNIALDAYISDAQFARGNSDSPEEWFMDATRGAMKSSDHDGLVLYIQPE